MCGIVGTAGFLLQKDTKALKDLLILDTLRGFDSTGVFGVRIGGKKVFVSKQATHCFNLFARKDFEEAANSNASIAVVGHNRAATSGKVHDINAHPFVCGDVTGVMNGTLEDSDKRILEEMLGQKFDVDSEALFAAIDKFGVKEVIPELTKGRDAYKGAWSLVWQDTKEPDMLNFLRNDHRPMWYCFVEDFKQIFFASEFWMLDAALSRNGYKIWQKESEKNPGKFYRFFQTPVDMHLKLNINELQKGSKTQPKFIATPCAGKEPAEVKNTYNPFPQMQSGKESGKASCGSKSENRTKSSKTSTKTNQSSTSSGSELACIQLLGDVDNPYAGYVKQREFEWFGHTHKINGNPCCNWCHEEVPYGMSGITVFFRDNILLCSKCSGHGDISVLSDIAPANRFYVTRAMFQEMR